MHGWKNETSFWLLSGAKYLVIFTEYINVGLLVCNTKAKVYPGSVFFVSPHFFRCNNLLLPKKSRGVVRLGFLQNGGGFGGFVALEKFTTKGWFVTPPSGHEKVHPTRLTFFYPRKWWVYGGFGERCFSSWKGHIIFSG